MFESFGDTNSSRKSSFKKEIKNSKYFYCPNCQKVPIIQVMEDNSIKIQCNCYESDIDLTLEESETMDIYELSKYKSYCISLEKFNEIVQTFGEEEYAYCSLEEKHGKVKAKVYCPECKEFYCEDCKNVHRLFRGEHKVYESTGMRVNLDCEEEDCPTQEKIKFHCTQCNMSLCYACASQHRRHTSLVIIDKYIKEEKEKFLCLEQLGIISCQKLKAYHQIHEKYLKNLFQQFEQKKKTDEELIKYFYSLIKTYYITQDFTNFNIRKNIVDNYIDRVIYAKSKYFESQIQQLTNNFLTNANFLIQSSTNISCLEAMYEIEDTEYPTQIIGQAYNELNENNCRLYINGIKTDFCKEFKFTNPGKNRVEIEMKEGTQLKSMLGMFNKIPIVSIDVSTFDTSQVTNMSCLFSECHKLHSINFGNFNTEKVVNMSALFQECYSLASIDLSSFDTSRVVDMSCLFNECKKLTSLDITNFNTSRVTSMSALFQKCFLLTSIDLSSFDTSSVMDMSLMFNRCSKLESINLSNFNTERVINMSGLFQLCTSLTFVDLGSFNTRNTTNISWMFNGCAKLTSVNLSSFNTEKVKNMERIFANCPSLTDLNISSFSISDSSSAQKMFESTPLPRKIAKALTVRRELNKNNNNE